LIIPDAKEKEGRGKDRRSERVREIGRDRYNTIFMMLLICVAQQQ
jgi:hypothetical protein